ncbi:hypothetical protein GMMP15_830006 [Candidatus Magnetomoraceae bacterium gMMP-15]
MKIDMSAKAITNRLKTVNQLKKICLSLANSSEGKRIRKQFKDEIVSDIRKPNIERPGEK